MLIGAAPDETIQRTWIEPLRRVLREHGFEEGRNLTIDIRWAEGRPERLPALAAELLALGPDVIVTAGPRPALATKEATRTVPVVAAAVDNPVLMGLAATLARPGGNVTGVSSWGIELLAKRLQLLGLASYQSDFTAIARRAAALAAMILGGAKPAEMPFERATRLDLVVSLKAARALGIKVPPGLLAGADEVLE